MSDIGTQVRDILAFHLGIDASQLADDTRFEDLGADSLEVAEIVMALESEFGVPVPDDAPEFIKTVGDAVSYIAERVGK